MDPVVARVRELAIEEIDRQEDVDRVLESGPWPALIWDDCLWPHAEQGECDRRFAILVDTAGELSQMDRSRLYGGGGGKKAASLAPTAEVRRMLAGIAREIDDRRDAKEAAEFMRRTDLARWRKERCTELSVWLQRDGLVCPRCRDLSREHRFVTAFFICRACGCSFRPEEMPGETPPG